MHLAVDHFVNHLQSLHGNLLKRPLVALWVLRLEMPLSGRLRWEKLRSTLSMWNRSRGEPLETAGTPILKPGPSTICQKIRKLPKDPAKDP